MNRAIQTTILSVLFTYLSFITSGQTLAASAASNSTASQVKPASTEPNQTKSSMLEEKTYVQKKEMASDYDLFLTKHNIEIGAETYHYRYEETGGVETKGDCGKFYGGSVNYIYRWWVPGSKNEPLIEDNRGSLRGEFRFNTGEADYDGYLSDGTPHKINDIEHDIVEGRLLIGIDVLDKNWLASLSTGVGYRYSTDDTSFDPYGYERESNYLYFPLAYQLDSKFVNNWAIGFKLEADLVTWGEQKSHLSDVNDNLPNITNHQDRGWGLRGSVRLQNRTPIGVFIVEPFVRYWNIQKSDRKVVDSVAYWEPKNNTTELGVQVVWQF